MRSTSITASPDVTLLLLSRGLGAVPQFVETWQRAGAGPAAVGFVAAATAGDPTTPDWVTADRTALTGFGYDLVDVDLTELRGQALDERLAVLDVLYVAGGNTFLLLHHLRASGLFTSLGGHLAQGLLYIGASAGAIVAGPDAQPLSLMDDPADAPAGTPTTGLGFVDVVPVPHADGALPPYPARLIRQIETTYGATHTLQPITDQQALVVTGGRGALIDSPVQPDHQQS